MKPYLYCATLTHSRSQDCSMTRKEHLDRHVIYSVIEPFLTQFNRKDRKKSKFSKYFTCLLYFAKRLLLSRATCSSNNNTWPARLIRSPMESQILSSSLSVYYPVQPSDVALQIFSISFHSTVCVVPAVTGQNIMHIYERITRMLLWDGQMDYFKRKAAVLICCEVCFELCFVLRSCKPSVTVLLKIKMR